MVLQTRASRLRDLISPSSRSLALAVATAALGIILSSSLPSYQASATAYRVPPRVAQEASDLDETEVSPAQLEKYVAVYKAMQRDRSLSVEAAAAQNGMTLDAFRALESQVQRDEAALQRAREELQTAVKQPQSTGSP